MQRIVACSTAVLPRTSCAAAISTARSAVGTVDATACTACIGGTGMYQLLQHQYCTYSTVGTVLVLLTDTVAVLG